MLENSKKKMLCNLSALTQSIIQKWKHLVIWQVLDMNNEWVDYNGNIGAYPDNIYRIRPECCIPIEITTIVPYCEIGTSMAGKYLWLIDTKKKDDNYLELTLLSANKKMVDQLEPGDKPKSFTMGF